MIQPIVIHTNTPGSNLTAKFYSAGIFITSVALTETPVASGRYIATTADLTGITPNGLAAGFYDVRVEDVNGTLIGAGELRWTGAAEQFVLVADQSYVATNETTSQSNTVKQVEV